MKIQRAAFDYEIDQDIGLAVVRVTGEVSGRDIARFAERLQSDADWAHDYAAIWDERGITSLDVTPDDMDVMVKGQAGIETGPDVVVTAQEDHELIMKLYAWRVRARGRPATVCSSMEEALDHLGVDELPPRLKKVVRGA